MFNKKEMILIGVIGVLLLFSAGLVVHDYQKKEDVILASKTEQQEEKVVHSKAKVKEVVVDVSGAVKHPGVYTLHTGQRVVDALNQAGGATARGDVEMLNLAQPLTDGQKIIVPEKMVMSGGQGGAASIGSGAQDLSRGNSRGSSGNGGMVSINNGSESDLVSLPGIGPSLAKRIVDYRSSHGGFATLENLKDVPGIGDKKYDNLKDNITL